MKRHGPGQGGEQPGPVAGDDGQPVSVRNRGRLRFQKSDAFSAHGRRLARHVVGLLDAEPLGQPNVFGQGSRVQGRKGTIRHGVQRGVQRGLVQVATGGPHGGLGVVHALRRAGPLFGGALQHVARLEVEFGQQGLGPGVPGAGTGGHGVGRRQEVEHVEPLGRPHLGGHVRDGSFVAEVAPGGGCGEQQMAFDEEGDLVHRGPVLSEPGQGVAGHGGPGCGVIGFALAQVVEEPGQHEPPGLFDAGGDFTGPLAVVRQKPGQVGDGFEGVRPHGVNVVVVELDETFHIAEFGKDRREQPGFHQRVQGGTGLLGQKDVQQRVEGLASVPEACGETGGVGANEAASRPGHGRSAAGGFEEGGQNRVRVRRGRVGEEHPVGAEADARRFGFAFDAGFHGEGFMEQGLAHGLHAGHGSVQAREEKLHRPARVQRRGGRRNEPQQSGRGRLQIEKQPVVLAPGRQVDGGAGAVDERLILAQFGHLLGQKHGVLAHGLGDAGKPDGLLAVAQSAQPVLEFRFQHGRCVAVLGGPLQIVRP